MIDIIHGGPTHPSIIPLEPHGLDQIHGHAHAGSEPQNGANVSGNLRLEKSNPHPSRLSQIIAILNVRDGAKTDPALMAGMAESGHSAEVRNGWKADISAHLGAIDALGRKARNLQRMTLQSVNTASPVIVGPWCWRDVARSPLTDGAMHALIIEDESLIAMAIEDALRCCGFTSFEVAVSAEEAMTAARRKCPDLITADVELRPGCGITAVQSICSDRPIPILFITGTPSEVRIRMPGYALVEKPFSAHQIVDAIKLTSDSRDG